MDAYFDQIERDTDNTPRVTVLLNRVYEAQAEVLDADKRRDLEAMELSLGLHRKFKQELTNEDERSFVERLEKITGATL